MRQVTNALNRAYLFVSLGPQYWYVNSIKSAMNLGVPTNHYKTAGSNPSLSETAEGVLLASEVKMQQGANRNLHINNPQIFLYIASHPEVQRPELILAKGGPVNGALLRILTSLFALVRTSTYLSFTFGPATCTQRMLSTLISRFLDTIAVSRSLAKLQSNLDDQTSLIMLKQAVEANVWWNIAITGKNVASRAVDGSAATVRTM